MWAVVISQFVIPFNVREPLSLKQALPQRPSDDGLPCTKIGRRLGRRLYVSLPALPDAVDGTCCAERFTWQRDQTRNGSGPTLIPLGCRSPQSSRRRFPARFAEMAMDFLLVFRVD